MRTFISGKWIKDRDIIVHFHGYGGSSVLQNKILQDLDKEFNQIMFDNIGMGASSKPMDFSSKFTPTECIDFFIKYIEKWR